MCKIALSVKYGFSYFGNSLLPFSCNQLFYIYSSCSLHFLTIFLFLFLSESHHQVGRFSIWLVLTNSCFFLALFSICATFYHSTQTINIEECRMVICATFYHSTLFYVYCLFCRNSPWKKSFWKSVFCLCARIESASSTHLV